MQRFLQMADLLNFYFCTFLILSSIGRACLRTFRWTRLIVFSTGSLLSCISITIVARAKTCSPCTTACQWLQNRTNGSDLSVKKGSQGLYRRVRSLPVSMRCNDSLLLASMQGSGQQNRSRRTGSVKIPIVHGLLFSYSIWLVCWNKSKYILV